MGPAPSSATTKPGRNVISRASSPRCTISHSKSARDDPRRLRRCNRPLCELGISLRSAASRLGAIESRPATCIGRRNPTCLRTTCRRRGMVARRTNSVVARLHSRAAPRRRRCRLRVCRWQPGRRIGRVRRERLCPQGAPWWLWSACALSNGLAVGRNGPWRAMWVSVGQTALAAYAATLTRGVETYIYFTPNIALAL
jgi:hypothetical protein